MMLATVALSRSLAVQGPKKIWPPLSRKASMVGPLGVLPMGPVVATTEVEEMSMAGPLGGATYITGSGRHLVARRRWWAPW
jgi:hypothetical protein